MSLSGSLDLLDSYEIEDEIETQIAKENEKFFNRARNHEKNNLSIEDDLSKDLKVDAEALAMISKQQDSLDLDNSEDLNKIIQKYEKMLG